MTRVEDLQGIHGRFESQLGLIPDPKIEVRPTVYGRLTYDRTIGDETKRVTIPVRGVRIRRLHGLGIDDDRRYVRVERGPKGNKDKIIGLID